MHPQSTFKARSTLSLILIALLTSAALFPADAATSPREARTDQAGRRVHPPADPRRIISFAPSITEIIFALGRESRLKAATMFSDYPPEARKLPRVGSYVRLDLEKIVALKPDLCLATKDGNPKEIVDRLAAFKIPVYVVDPRDMESVMAAILELGGLLDAEEKARAIVSDMETRIRKVKALAAGIPRKPLVFFQIGVSPIVSAGSTSFIHELIETAGGINAASGPDPYPRFSREQILALAPEVIILTPMAETTVFEKARREWLRWPNLPAAKNGRIHLVDSDLFHRPSPRLVDALEALAPLIHPGMTGGDDR